MQAPAGWINDPCAPMYDPWRDEYHIMYQWHTNHVAWGNVSWGHAKSKDMIIEPMLVGGRTMKLLPLPLPEMDRTEDLEFSAAAVGL